MGGPAEAGIADRRARRGGLDAVDRKGPRSAKRETPKMISQLLREAQAQ
jgi:hypothetical protein